MDIRRDREDGWEHGSARMVGHDDQGGWGRDEQDGVVVLSMGGTRPRSIGGSSDRFGGFMDVLTGAYVSRDDGTNRTRSAPVPGSVVLMGVDRCRVPHWVCGWGARTEA